MTPEAFDEQLKDLILENGGDIDITNYPYVLKEAQELGLSGPDLARRIKKVYDSIDRRPYDKIDKMLEDIILKGSITESEADAITTAVSDSLPKAKAGNYMVVILKKKEFEPREQHSFEHDSFKNLWMTNRAWEKYQRDLVVVKWLGKDARSLAELGKISYDDPVNAKYYLRNANALVPAVNALTKDVAVGDAYSRIIEDETNVERRYYKVIYTLNPQLSFRFSNEDVKDIHALLDMTGENYANNQQAISFFTEGYIPIWLQQTDAVSAAKLPSSLSYESFLKFIYRLNPAHPFYVKTMRFSTPELLAKHAEENAGNWLPIAEVIKNHQLLIWLEGIGKQYWVDKIEAEFSGIKQTGFYTEEEKLLAIVQFFSNLVDKESKIPALQCEPEQVNLLKLEGSKTVQQPIAIRLTTTGFTKANIYLDKEIDGIWLDGNSYTFWSQNGKSECIINLFTDALQLVKSKPYSFNVKIDTAHQNLLVPVKVEVVFPAKAFLLQMAKYGLFGVLLFGLVRYLAGTIGGHFSSFSLADLYDASRSSAAVGSIFLYFLLLCLLAIILVASVFIIRKTEKL